MLDPEFIEQLKQVDEISLLELLHINSTDIIDCFMDKIEDYEESIRTYLND